MRAPVLTPVTTSNAGRVPAFVQPTRAPAGMPRRSPPERTRTLNCRWGVLVATDWDAPWTGRESSTEIVSPGGSASARPVTRKRPTASDLRGGTDEHPRDSATAAPIDNSPIRITVHPWAKPYWGVGLYQSSIVSDRPIRLLKSCGCSGQFVITRLWMLCRSTGLDRKDGTDRWDRLKSRATCYVHVSTWPQAWGIQCA